MGRRARQWRARRQALPAALLLALTAAAGAAPQAAPPAPAEVQEGLLALDRADFQAAAEAFERSAATARSAEHPRWLADSFFYLGLTRQREARATEEPARRPAILAEAAAYYRRALHIDPSFGAAANNLARLHLEQGDREKAAELLARAVGLGDERQGFYAASYGELLEESGQDSEAFAYYRLAVEARPEDEDSHRAVLRLGIRDHRSELVDHLLGLLEGGWAERATLGAVEALGDDGWGEAARAELLSLAAVGLAAQAYSPVDLHETPAGAALMRLASGSTEASAPARELLRLHLGERVDVGGFSWWADRGPERIRLHRGRSLARLARSLADRFLEAGAEREAESRYRLAVELSPDARLDALIALADLYFRERRWEELERLGEEHVPELFEGKGAAYRERDWAQVYRFHRTLGVLYSHLGRWGDSATPTSAIFQLEHARIAAERLAEEGPSARSGTAPAPALEVRLLELLATGYEATGRPSAARELRESAAELSVTRKRDLPVEGGLDPEGGSDTELDLREDRELRLLKVNAAAEEPPFL